MLLVFVVGSSKLKILLEVVSIYPSFSLYLYLCTNRLPFWGVHFMNRFAQTFLENNFGANLITNFACLLKTIWKTVIGFCFAAALSFRSPGNAKRQKRKVVVLIIMNFTRSFFSVQQCYFWCEDCVLKF